MSPLETTEQASDALLHAYLSAPRDSVQEDVALRDLLDLAMPVVQSVLRSKLRQSSLGEPVPQFEQQELYGEALLKVVRRLQLVKEEPSSEPIANFSGYVAVIAYNTFHAYIRQKYPDRQRLRNRVRYVLRTSRKFAAWPASSGETVCGRSAWKLDGRAPVNASWDLPPDDTAVAVGSVDDVTPTILLAALEAIFEGSAAPVELDQLVKIIANYLRLSIAAQRTADLDEVELVDGAPSAESAMLERSTLEYLWKEIVELPPRQRAALLLNLRDGKGAGAISLLIVLEVAAFEAVAEAIGMGPDELAAVWNELPFDDLRIAQRLDLTRQQVINLRKSARERLARRLRSTGRR